jgi:hypothetical protein
MDGESVPSYKLEKMDTAHQEGDGHKGSHEEDERITSAEGLQHRIIVKNRNATSWTTYRRARHRLHLLSGASLHFFEVLNGWVS